MKINHLAITLLTLVLAFSATRVNAAVSMVISPNTDGTVSLTITATGSITATNDTFLLIGSNLDSFLPNGAPQRYSGTVPSAPIPQLTLGSSSAFNNFYRDDDSGFTGLESIIGFFFPSGLNGLLDLNDLNGVYYLPESRFSDFQLGTFNNLQSGTRPEHLQGLGEISIQVVPEPSSVIFVSLSTLLILGRRVRKIAGESGRGDGIAPVTPPTPPDMRVRSIQWRVTSFFKFGLPSPSWMS
jgi:hypothetical protein